MEMIFNSTSKVISDNQFQIEVTDIGSGKTRTVTGTVDNPEMVAAAADEILAPLEELDCGLFGTKLDQLDLDGLVNSVINKTKTN